MRQDDKAVIGQGAIVASILEPELICIDATVIEIERLVDEAHDRGPHWSPLGQLTFGLRESVGVAALTTGLLIFLR